MSKLSDELRARKGRMMDKLELRNMLGGIMLDDDPWGDNLAIALCSYFDDHSQRPEDDPEGEHGWSVWVEQKANKALDRVAAAVADTTEARELDIPSTICWGSRNHHRTGEHMSKQLTFDEFRAANVARCIKWHPQGIQSWSSSDWLTAVTGELGELASLLKMRNRERDGLPGNKFSPTNKQVADELADVLTYLDLLAAALGVDLGRAAAQKFNEVSERVGFPDRIEVA